MEMILYFLFILTVLTSVFFDKRKIDKRIDKWEGYSTGKGGVKWLPNCDIPGYDVGRKEITRAKCRQICLFSHSKDCNAFSWQDGWCYMKDIPAHSLTLKPTTSGMCGVLPWEFENNEDVASWKEDDSIGNGFTWRPDLPNPEVENCELSGDRGPNGLEDDVTEQSPQIKCAYIKNVAFNEYLYATTNQLYDENNRSIFTWRSRRDGHPCKWSTTQGLWILEEGQKNVYSIKNAYHQELLFASECMHERYQRGVFTWKNPDRFAHGHLHWELEHVTGDTFYIKNRMFNEFLYAVEDELTFNPYRRNVHTWTQSRIVSSWAGAGEWVVETTKCPSV